MWCPRNTVTTIKLSYKKHLITCEERDFDLRVFMCQFFFRKHSFFCQFLEVLIFSYDGRLTIHTK
jgi:hypothetical protein